MPRFFSALRYRNFRLFFSGQFVSLTGSWMHSTAQGWLVLKLTDSPFYLGLVGAVGGLPILLFSLAGGVAADRFRKKDLLLTTQIMFTLLSLTLAVLVTLGLVNIWHILLLAFFIGLVGAFDLPAKQSFIMEMVERESVLNAVALNSVAFNGARIVGPAIAGLIIGSFGLAVCFYINALTFIALIMGFLKMRLDAEPAPSTKRHSNVIEEFKEGIRYILNEPRVYTIIALVAITSLFGFPYITFLPVYARDILQTGPAGLGILMGSAGAGAFTGAISLALRKDFKKKGLLFAVSGIIFPVALLIFSHSTLPSLSYAMLFLAGLGAVSQLATANSILQITAPEGLRGRVMSAFTLMFLGMATIGNFIVGGIAHHIGTQGAVAMGAALSLSGIILPLWKKPEVLKI